LTLSRFRKTAPSDASLLPSPDQVVRGWVLTSDRASRVAPEAATLVAARCEISLMTAHEIDELLDADPARGILTIAERVRMGDNPQEWTSQLADAARRVAKHPQRSPWTSRALVMAARTLLAASETLAADDVVELWQRTNVSHSGAAADGGDTTGATDGAIDRVAAIEQRFVRAVSRTSAAVLPTGIPDAWRGVSVEAHGLVASPHHRISLALRWHAANVALLWEIDGPPGLSLSAPLVDPKFQATELQGEALLQVAP
jgi:hypothetical protein